MFVILISILAIAYVVLKTLNVRAEFARRDAEKLREQQAAMEKEAAEAEEAEEETDDGDEDTESEVI